MDKNAHYLIVGLFVIITTIAGLIFGAWLYGGQTKVTEKRYEIHFSESVDGLNKGSEVRYMGIKVGQVESANLLTGQADKISVIISVKDDTPIHENTVATLRTQGVTGITYINLIQKADYRKKGPTINDASKLPIIDSAPSDLGGLIQSLPDLQESLNKLLNGANQALSQKNLENLSSVLVNINTLMKDANRLLSNKNVNNLASILDNLNKASQASPALITDLRKTTKKLNKLIGNMDQLVSNNEANLTGSIKELRQTLNNISGMTQQYNRLALQLNKMATKNEEKVNELIDDGGHDLKQLLIESKRTATVIRRLAEKLEQNPSQILYESPTKGVKIPR
jgi:phospholipid/cholesterol/gamma-HCH transport system substrate-binding protein